MGVGVPGRGDVRGLERNSGGDIVSGRRAASTVRGGKRRVMGSLVVASWDEDRDGFTPLGARSPKGSVEDSLYLGAEYPAPGRHIALDHGAVPGVYRDLPPAVCGRLSEEVHGQGSRVRLSLWSRVNLGKRDAADL